MAQRRSTTILRGALAAFTLLTLAVLLKITPIPILNVVLAFTGIAATLMLSMFLDKAHRFSYLQTWGQRSLEIYLAHSIFSATAAAAAYKLLGSDYLTVEVLLSLLAGMAGPLRLYQACQRWQLMFLFRL